MHARIHNLNCYVVRYKEANRSKNSTVGERTGSVNALPDKLNGIFKDFCEWGINILKKYPVFSVVGTLITAMLEFVYALRFAGVHGTLIDLAVMSTLMLPLLVSVYSDNSLH